MRERSLDADLALALTLNARVLLRDEPLNGEIFYTLTEAKVLVQRWRQLYNRVRHHSALGYRPPAPEAIEPLPPGFPELLDIGEQRLT